MPCGYCGKEGPLMVSIRANGPGVSATSEFCSVDHFGLFVKRIKRLPTRENKPRRRRRNAKGSST